MSPARVGEQYGPETYPLVNFVPVFASESMFGVGMSLQPWNPTSAKPMSSPTITMMLGFSAAKSAEAVARIANAANANRVMGVSPEWRRGHFRRKSISHRDHRGHREKTRKQREIK